MKWKMLAVESTSANMSFPDVEKQRKEWSRANQEVGFPNNQLFLITHAAQLALPDLGIEKGNEHTAPFLYHTRPCAINIEGILPNPC